MSKWKIYSKTGVERAVADSLQYNGTRMGERFLTVTVKSASPISFAVGDYIMYRNEKFEINYEPTLLKKAASGKYGEGFTYNDIKFNSLADELVRCDFCDIVLEESQEASQVHYTGLPEFGFFAETVDDLLDRIQANLDSIYPAPVDVAFFESLSPEDAITTYLSLGTPFTYNGLPVQMGTTVVSGTDILICKKPNGDFMMFQLVNYEPDWETNRRYHYTGNVSASDTSVAEYFANSDKIDASSKHWVILSPDYDRSMQRGATDAEWGQYFESSEYTYGTVHKMVSVSSQKCWDALLLSYNTFKEPFIIHGRTIIVGSEGNVVLQNFKYGKGNGLYEIERNADSNQEIVTRLRAYGTQQNVPYKYYAMRYAMPYAVIDVSSAITTMEIDWLRFYTLAVVGGDIIQNFPEVLTSSYISDVGPYWNRAEVRVYETFASGSYEDARDPDGGTWSHKVLIMRRGDFGNWKYAIPGTDDNDWIIATQYWNMFLDTWTQEPSENGKMYFYGGVNKYKCPYTALVSSGEGGLPTQMDVMNLMLPGFPDQSLYDWIKSRPWSETTYHNDETGQATWNGKTAYFSKDRLRPYIDSLEVDNIGIRPQSETFDGTNDKEEIYPTISEVTIGDLHDAGYDTAEKGWTDDEQRIDTVQMRSEYLVTDDGFVYESDENGKKKMTKNAETGEMIPFKDTFFVDLPFLGFDLKKAIEDAGGDCQLSVIDGKLGGREFTIKGVDDNMYERGGKYYWKVECERIQDTGIGLWFPYASYNFSIENTDHYVLLGINLPDSYVDAAATRLLKAALIFLDNNDETRYVIQPRIDELFMARNHDAVVAQREENPSDGSKSIYEVIEEGTIFNIDDDDFGEYHLPIQQLTIKEYGNGSIPTFDVTLMEEPQTSSIQKQVDEAVNTAVREGGWTATGIKNMIASYGSNLFLSKNNNDTASGEIGLLKGLWIKTKGLFGFDADGNIKGNDIDAAGDVTARSLKSTGSNGNTTADIDNSTQKNLGLEVAESGVIGGILRVAKNILTKTIQSLNFSGGDSLFGTGWQLTDDYGNGRSRLVVDDAVFRGKVVMNELEVRKLTAMGGNYVFSPAASIIEEVDYFDANGNVLGYEYVKVPWVLRLIPLSLLGRYLSRKKWVRSTMSDDDYDLVKFYRCWLKADDGSTQTINTWKEGMLARCQTFDTSQIENGDHEGKYESPDTVLHGKDVRNKLYWRAVVAVAEGKDKSNYTETTVALNDGRKHNYIDLANYTEGGVQLYLTNSDHVSAGDHIVCYGDWKDVSLSNIIALETVGDDAPAIKEFVGVGYNGGTSIDWSMTGKEKTRISPTTFNKFVAPDFTIETPNGNTSVKVGMQGISTRVEQIEEDTYITKEVDIDADDLLSNTFFLPQGDYELYIKSISHFNDDYAYIDLVKTGTRKNIAYIESDYEDYIGNFTIAVNEAGYYSIDVRDDEYSTHGTISEIFIKTRVASYSEFKQTSDSIVASVKNVERSNIFVGIADGTGWTYGYFDADNISFRTKVAVTQGEAQILAITSPVSKLLAKGKYVISFYATAHGTSNDYTLTITDDSDTPVTLFEATTEDGTLIEITDDFATASNLKRYYFVFELSTAKKIKVIFSQSAVGMFVLTDATYYRPLLQTGEYPTEFSFGQVTSEAYMKITADGITSQVNAIKKGKNLLTGVLTGKGWSSNGTSANVNDDYGIYGFYTGGSSWTLKSPNTALMLEASKNYTLSFYCSQSPTVGVYSTSGTLLTTLTISEIASDTITVNSTSLSRKKATFSLSEQQKVYLYFTFYNTLPYTSPVYYPQIESGDTPTAFDAGDKETSSRIKQTADEIDLSVKNDYESAGLKIVPSGLQLRGGKVDFTGSDGVPYIKVSVDANHMPHLIFLAQDGETEMYDLGYTGLTQLVNNAMPDRYDAAMLLASLVGGNYYPYSSSGDDVDSINPKSLYYMEDSNNSDSLHEYPVWFFSEGYTINGQGTKIWTHGGTYDRSYVKTRDYTDTLDNGWYFIFSELNQNTGIMKFRVIHTVSGKIDAECTAYAEHWNNGSQVHPEDVTDWKYRCWIVSNSVTIAAGYTAENGADSGNFYYMYLSPLQDLL